MPDDNFLLLMILAQCSDVLQAKGYIAEVALMNDLLECVADRVETPVEVMKGVSAHVNQAAV